MVRTVRAFISTEVFLETLYNELTGKKDNVPRHS
jgi:hypothetical protein